MSAAALAVGKLFLNFHNPNSLWQFAFLKWVSEEWNRTYVFLSNY